MATASSDDETLEELESAPAQASTSRSNFFARLVERYHEDKPKLRDFKQLFLDSVANCVDVDRIRLKYRFPKDPANLTHFHANTNVQGSIRLTFKGSSSRTKIWLFIKMSPFYIMPIDRSIKLDLPSMYHKEMYFYRHIVPRLTDFQILDADRRKRPVIKGHEAYENLFPQCYATRASLDKQKDADLIIDEDALIVLEYMPTEFFSFESPGFTVGFAINVVRKLALFHAVPLAYKIKHRELYEELVAPIFFTTCADSDLLRNAADRRRAKYLPIFNKSQICCTQEEIDFILEYVQTTEELSEHYDRIKNALDASYRAKREPPEAWVGMCHGKFMHFHLRGHVFKFWEMGSCRILDFRHLIERHILTDLAFFLITSLLRGVLPKKYDQLTLLYYTTLITELRRYGIDSEDYNFDTYQEELKIVIKSELLRAVQQFKYFSSKYPDDYKEELRSLASFPNIKKQWVKKNVHEVLYRIRLANCFHNLMETNLI